MFDSKEERDVVLSQMKDLQNRGVVKLFDARRVQRVATKMGMEDLVLCLGGHPFENYGELLKEFTKQYR